MLVNKHLKHNNICMKKANPLSLSDLLSFGTERIIRVKTCMRSHVNCQCIRSSKSFATIRAPMSWLFNMCSFVSL